jgi:hypothetical protein
MFHETSFRTLVLPKPFYTCVLATDFIRTVIPTTGISLYTDDGLLSTLKVRGYQDNDNMVIADMAAKYDASLAFLILFDHLIKMEDFLPNGLYPYAPGMCV